MFSAFAAGAFLFVTGAIGYDISYMRGMFRGGRWAEDPIWWQLALGTGLLFLGYYFFRRLGLSASRAAESRGGGVKKVGHGMTAGAQQRIGRPRAPKA